MPQWIKFKLKERPFYDPRTGVILPDIEGRKNRPRVDPFEGGGKVYPDLSSVSIHSWHERGKTLMLLVDDPAAVIPMKGKGFYKASPKVTREYDLSEHAPVARTDDEALNDLIQEIGLPEGTTLDADKRPVIPEKETAEIVTAK